MQVLNEMPRPLKNAAISGDSDVFDKAIDDYFKKLSVSLEKGGSTSYSLKDVANMKISGSGRNSIMSFLVKDKNDQNHSIKILIPSGKIGEINKFIINIDDQEQKISQDYLNIEKGASYVQLAISNLLKQFVQTSRKRKASNANSKLSSFSDYQKNRIGKKFSEYKLPVSILININEKSSFRKNGIKGLFVLSSKVNVVPSSPKSDVFITSSMVLHDKKRLVFRNIWKKDVSEMIDKLDTNNFKNLLSEKIKDFYLFLDKKETLDFIETIISSAKNSKEIIDNLDKEFLRSNRDKVQDIIKSASKKHSPIDF